MKHYWTFLLSAFLFLGITSTAQAVAGGNTVLTKLLAIQNNDALNFQTEYGIDPNTYTYEAWGQTYTGALPTLGGYEKVFKKTGGPTLRKIAGLNLSFLMNPTSMTFLIYTAFLTLMVGFYWFRIMNEASEGKAGGAIIPIVVPFLGKLAVGLIVAYNLPFVYGMAMKLKDVGILTAVAALQDGTAQNLVQADPSTMTFTDARAQGVRDAVAEKITAITFILDSTEEENQGEAKETGRKMISRVVSLLNAKIKAFNDDAKRMTMTYDGDTNKQVWESAAVKTDPPISYVGFEKLADSGSIGGVVLPDSDITNTAKIQAAWTGTASVEQELQRKITRKLTEYLELSAISNKDESQANMMTRVVTGPLYLKSGELGEDLKDTDEIFILRGEGNITDYQNNIRDKTASYIDETFIEPLQDVDKPGWWERIKGSTKSAMTSLVTGVLSIPKMLADLLVDLVRKFWIPMVAHMANFLFNVTIEAYVYLLMLAYPLWFHKKTEQAFKGALNTLIATAFTAATFCYLILAFESFAGYLMSYLTGFTQQAQDFMNANTGAAAASGIAVIGVAVGGGLGAMAGATLGIAVGYSIFYIIGTAICLSIAPKVFKAFLTGGSVVTPILMGAATAVVGGAMTGIMAAAAAPAALAAVKGGGAMMAAKAGGAIAKTKAGQAVGKRISSIGGRMKQFALDKAIRPSDMVARGQLNRRDKKGAMNYVKGVAQSTAGRMMQAPGAAFKGAAAAGAAIKRITPDPKKALIRLANSPVTRIGVTAVAGMGGNLSKMAGAFGTMTYGGQLLQNMASRNEARTTNTTPSMSNERPQGSNRGGGGSNQGGGTTHINKTVINNNNNNKGSGSDKKA